MDTNEQADNYKFDDQDRKHIDQKIKRKYNRTKPPGERTTKQLETIAKMREGLERSRKLKKELKESHMARSQNITERQPIIKNPPQIVKHQQRSPKITHEDNAPVYRDDFESDNDNDNEFMITDNNSVNFIVRPVRKRQVVEPKKRQRRAPNKVSIEEKINKDKLNNIVDHQLEAIQTKKLNSAPVVSTVNRPNTLVNVYKHHNVVEQKETVIPVKTKKFFSMDV